MKQGGVAQVFLLNKEKQTQVSNASLNLIGIGYLRGETLLITYLSLTGFLFMQLCKNQTDRSYK